MTIRKSLIVSAIALALAAPGFASAQTATPHQAPAAHAQKEPTYAEKHHALVGVLTQIKTTIEGPEVTALSKSVSDELAKLPAIQKEYVDAANKGDTAAADAAAAKYSAEIDTIRQAGGKLAGVPQGVQQVLGMLMMQLGPDGDKLMKEKDVAALVEQVQKSLDTAMKPLKDAGTTLGPIVKEASTNAQVRLQQEKDKIVKEEMDKAVKNYLEGKRAD